MDKSTIENHFQGNFQAFYSHYLPTLRKSKGDEMMAICPFHADTDPSLSVNNQTGVFFCHGCHASGSLFDFYARQNNMDTRADFPTIVKVIATTFAIRNGDKQTVKTTVVSHYDYLNEDGKLVYQIERLQPKAFRIRRPDGQGWTYNAKGINLIPYHLPEVSKADEVLIVEGEKDADNLAALGFTATTNPFGAGKWTDEFGSHFAGKDVVLIPDNDEVGSKHMHKVAANLKSHAASIKWLELPNLPDKGDASDFLATFSYDEEAVERLAIMLDGAVLYKPPENISISQESAESEYAIVPKQDPLIFPDIMAGAAGNFARVYSSYMEPPANFFFMAYLACLGNIIGGHVSLKSELSTEPRLYLLILGESADDRKSTAISKTICFFKETVTDFPVCFGIGSAEGLQKKLEERNRLMLCFDEFRAFTSKCKIDGSVLMPCVTTLFESRHYESQTAKKSVVINDASLSIMAASTIDTYEQIFDEHFLGIGFPNRIFLCPGKGERKFSLPEKIPDNECSGLSGQLGLLLQHAEQHPEFEILPDARHLYHAWYMSLPQSLHTKRLDTYAMRFMPLLAINELKEAVDVEIIQKVIALCNWQYEARRRYDPIDADSKMARAEEKIRRVLQSGPKNKRDLGRAVHSNRIGTWIFDTALGNLIKAEQVVLDNRTKLYRLI